MNANHTPLPWTFRDVPSAGLEIYAPVKQVKGAIQNWLPHGLPEEIQVYHLNPVPQTVCIAYERWVQFEKEGWHEMQEANAQFIVRACNSHYELIQALEGAQRELYLIRSKDCDAVYDPTLRARIPDVLAKAKGEI